MNYVKEILRYILSVLFGVLSFLNISAQTNNFNILQDKFNLYSQGAITEKLFVHISKDLYLAGETAWFKIYCVEGTFHKPSSQSKVAYLEILDKDQKPVLQTKIELKNGSGSGSLYLPVSISSGNHRIRVYTNWMKNFSPDYYYVKNITIINSLQDVAVAQQEKDELAYDVQFFPEGGNIVSGIPGKIAFRVVDQQGKGIDFKGAVINRNNDTIARFRPLKFGIGNFSFTAAGNNTYKAVIILQNGKVIIKELPTVYETGYVMQLSDTGPSQVKVKVQSKGFSDPLYLLVHTGQEIKVAQATSAGGSNIEFLVDKDKLGEGISNFTIFNSAMKPVCERLYFKRPENYLKVEASTSQAEYTTRKKVDLAILSQDQQGQIESADMSLSVYRSDSLSAPEDILSYLWLRSDLGGNIESAGYYFENNNSEANEALDNLMLTHGWRRFRWEEVLQPRPAVFEFLPEREGHVISGKVINTRNNSGVSNINTYFSVPGKYIQLYGSRSDSNGEIKFFTKDFYGQNKVILQTAPQKDNFYRIDIDNPFSEKRSAGSFPQFNFPDGIKDQILMQSVSMQVQNIYLQNKLNTYLKPLVDSSLFYGTPDATYLLDNYTRFNTMNEVLREYVREAHITKNNKKPNLRLTNMGGAFGKDVFKDPPLMLLDGVPLFDENIAMKLNPLKIQKLEIIAGLYSSKDLTEDGVISFFTYKGDRDSIKLDPHAVTLNYEGMQLQREFFSPVYETEKQISGRIPDFRNLLYWDPAIQTDRSGKKQLSFYTSDQTGKYIIVLQGISADGKAGSKVLGIEVKNPVN